MQHKCSLEKRPSPSLGNKARRTIWWIAWILFFRFTPIPLFAWRGWLLKSFGATIGQRVSIYPRVSIWAPWNVFIADDATVGNDAILYSVDRINLGSGVVVSQGAYLCTASHDYNSPSFDLLSAPIVLESNVWVAAEAFVGPGVTAHRGSVIGARAVVVKSIPERVVVAGNPARRIGQRDEFGQNNLR